MDLHLGLGRFGPGLGSSGLRLHLERLDLCLGLGTSSLGLRGCGLSLGPERTVLDYPFGSRLIKQEICDQSLTTLLHFSVKYPR